MRRCWIWQQINRIQCLFSLELKFFTFFNIFFWDFSFNYFFFFLLLWVGIPRIRTRFLNIPYWSLWMGMIKFIHWFSSKSLNIYRNLSRIRDDPLFFCVHQLWYTFLCLTLLQYKAFKVGFLNHIYIYDARIYTILVFGLVLILWRIYAISILYDSKSELFKFKLFFFLLRSIKIVMWP